MANTPKTSAEYYPHYAAQKKTVPILKAKFGSDGYACWYQLLEMLCAAKGHFLDCSAPGDLDFLAVQMGIPVERIELILRELIFRGKLDRELWEKSRVLWCQNLVNNLSGLYSKRKIAPEKPIPGNQFDSRDGNGIYDAEKTRIRVKKRKEKKSKGNACLSLFENFWKAYPKKVAKKDAIRAWDKIQIDDELFKTIIAALEKQKRTPDWNKDGQKYIPYPATWLNGRRWEDEITDQETQETEDAADKQRRNLEVLEREARELGLD